MEVPSARRPAADRQGGARPDPKNEFGEPALGRSQDPWGTAQTGHPSRPVHGFNLYGASPGSAVADLEDLRPQPYGRNVAIDLFVVPTIAFQQLFAFLVLRYERRQLLWFAVTRNPTAEWLARQITEAFPWDTAPKYLIRDNDRAFGVPFKARVRAMGIRDRPISFRSPWQNGYLERLIGSVRHECTDHLIVFSEEHLRRILAKYSTYYNEIRTDPWRTAPSICSNLVFRSDSLNKLTPLRRRLRRCRVANRHYGYRLPVGRIALGACSRLHRGRCK
jgi:hypothetical protein